MEEVQDFPKQEQPPIDNNFRELTNKEKQEIPLIVESDKQPHLTRQWINEPETRPIGAIGVKGRDFYVGSVLKHGSKRATAVLYTNVDGKIMPRIFYKSRSDGGWRSGPGTIGEKISKGLGFHYTQETKPVDEIIDYLNNAEDSNNTIETSDDYLGKMQIFSDEGDEVFTFRDEIKKYDDQGVLRQFQDYPPGKYTKSNLRGVDLVDKFKNFDWDKNEILEVLKNVMNEKGIKLPDIYEALIGVRQGLSLPDAFEILGKDKTIELIS